MVSRATLFAAVAAVAALVACADDGGPDAPIDQDGTVGGRVLLSLDGPLVGARVTVDHLEYLGQTIAVRSRVAELTTDADGHFSTATGQRSGYFRITTRGGAFRDYASGDLVVLDDADGLTALLYTDPLEDLTTGLVGPVTHLAHALIDARTRSGADADVVSSHALVMDHLDRHFGGLPWERIAPAALTQPQASPTAEVRAALILGAWSLLAQDIAEAAGATAQQVNPYTLARDLGRDLAVPPFDGNDQNDRAAGSGIQLALCAPVDPGCAPSPDGGCTLAACRTACDAYAGTPRTALAAAVTRLINDHGPGGRNQTGLSVADALRFARALADADDPLLFGDACAPVLDQTPPRITFGATPAPGALVRGAVEITAVATDELDPAPVVTLLELTDTDGAPASAAALVDTSAPDALPFGPDGPFAITATAQDAAGNRATATLPLVADNTPPVVTVSATGFLVDGATWWTTAAAPSLTGTASDLHAPITVRAYVLGAEVAATVAGPGGWSLTVPATALPGSGAAIAVRATDAVGNVSAVTAATSPFVKVDGSPPAVDGLARAFLDELHDAVAFSPSGPVHDHAAAGAVTLGASAPPSCPTIHKYAYLTAVTPVASERAPNPVALAFRAADTGIGVDPTASTFTVTAPGGQVFGPFPVVATPAVGAPGAFDHLTELRRDGPAAIAPIGLPGAVSRGRLHRHLHRPRSPRPRRLGSRAASPIAPSVRRSRSCWPRARPCAVAPSPRCAMTTRLDNTAPDARVAELVNGTRPRRRPRALGRKRHRRPRLRHVRGAAAAGADGEPHVPHPRPRHRQPRRRRPHLRSPRRSPRSALRRRLRARAPGRRGPHRSAPHRRRRRPTPRRRRLGPVPRRLRGHDLGRHGRRRPAVRRLRPRRVRARPRRAPRAGPRPARAARSAPRVARSLRRADHRRRRVPDVSQRHRQLRRRRQRALHALGALRSPQRPRAVARSPPTSSTAISRAPG
jgi:hypothetical protein